MAQYQCEAPSSWDDTELGSYFADFRGALEWDPSVVRAELTRGEAGAVGSVVTLSVKDRKGRVTEFAYELTERTATRVVLRAETLMVISEDTISWRQEGEQWIARYEAQLTLKGWKKLFDAVAQRALTGFGDDAAPKLRARLLAAR